jgi:hypothetical protein
MRGRNCRQCGMLMAVEFETQGTNFIVGSRTRSSADVHERIFWVVMSPATASAGS